MTVTFETDKRENTARHSLQSTKKKRREAAKKRNDIESVKVKRSVHNEAIVNIDILSGAALKDFSGSVISYYLLFADSSFKF